MCVVQQQCWQPTNVILEWHTTTSISTFLPSTHDVHTSIEDHSWHLNCPNAKAFTMQKAPKHKAIDDSASAQNCARNWNQPYDNRENNRIYNVRVSTSRLFTSQERQPNTCQYEPIAQNYRCSVLMYMYAKGHFANQLCINCHQHMHSTCIEIAQQMHIQHDLRYKYVQRKFKSQN